MDNISLSARTRRGPAVARLTIAPTFLIVGIVRLTRPGLFASLMPSIVPHPVTVIVFTGIAEMAEAVFLFVPRTRTLTGIMLALYAVCVFPVNINHAVYDLSTGTGIGWAYYYPRLFAQPFICWWALVAGAIPWAPTIAKPN